MQKKYSAEIVLARLLAVDLLPMYKLEKSKDIQNGWAAQGLNIPYYNDKKSDEKDVSFIHRQSQDKL